MRSRRITTASGKPSLGISRRENAPHAIGMIALARGLMAFMEGFWKESLAHCDQADEIIRNHCTGATWELDTSHSFALWSLEYMSDLADMISFHLINNDPAPAHDGLREVLNRWSRQGFHVQHHNGLRHQVFIDLYRGDGEAAWRRVSREWPAYKASQLMRIQQVRIEALRMRSCSALAAVASGTSPRSLLRIADGDARRLGREDVAWAHAHARFIHAGIAWARGDQSSAQAKLEEAAARYAAAGMHLCAAATRRRLGVLLGGDDGRTLVRDADSWMTDQQIRNPQRMADLYAPGFPN